MAAAQPPGQDRQRDPDTTLGDLLYANKAKTPIPESDWVGLVQSIARGDQLALHALYTQAHRIVFTLIMRITSNRATSEELTLDVFYDVWRRASSYDPEGGPVIGWIMNQARSRAIDRLRFDQRKKRVNDQGQLLREALKVLSTQERQAIETAFFSEMTYAEAAAQLNQPLGTVKTRIRSGLAALRQALADALRAR